MGSVYVEFCFRHGEFKHLSDSQEEDRGFQVGSWIYGGRQYGVRRSPKKGQH